MRMERPTALQRGLVDGQASLGADPARSAT